MVASENFQMESEEQNNISPEELVDVIKSISIKNKEDIISTSDIVTSSITRGDEIKNVPNNLKGVVVDVKEEDDDDAPLSVESLKKELRAQRMRNVPPVHTKIRRVPSTANPKHRTPILHKSQRSLSSPQIHSNTSPRRQSLPQSMPNITKSYQSPKKIPLFQDLYRHQLQTQQNLKKEAPVQDNGTPIGQQQIVYIEVPNLPASQTYDSQLLQKEISQQLQQLVPQIYSQLISHGNYQSALFSQSAPSVMLSDNNSNGRSPSPLSLNSNSSGETVAMQNKSLQHQGSLTPDNQPHRKRKKQIHIPAQLEIVNEKLNQANKQMTPESIAVSIQQQVNLLQNQLGAVDEQKPTSALTQITIPLSQELLLQCQQLQDPVSAAYQPRLETIHEESMSVKKLSTSTISKSKIFACILTVLSVIVVVALAGDRTIAVVVVTVVFLIFFLGLVGFLYLNSAKPSTGGLIS